MPFYRVTLIMESKIKIEDEIYDDVMDKGVGKNKVMEVENVEVADDFDEDEIEDREEDDEES